MKRDLSAAKSAQNLEIKLRNKLSKKLCLKMDLTRDTNPLNAKVKFN